MVTIPSAATLNDLHHMFKEHKFSRLPVFKEKVDNIIGIVSVMDLVSSVPKGGHVDSGDSSDAACHFRPGNQESVYACASSAKAHAQMAIVIDEYGGTSAL